MPSTASTPAAKVTPAHWVRAVGNAVNLSTVLGLAVAAAGRSSLRRGPQALVVAEDYRLPLPRAGAFTVGNVVLVPHGPLSAVELRQPGTLAHEAAHSWQYFWCLGLPFLPLYAVASGWSWLRRGDPASGNWFERNAGLARGGYAERPVTNAGLRRIARALHRAACERPLPGRSVSDQDGEMFRTPQLVLFTTHIEATVAFYTAVGFREVSRPAESPPTRVDLELDGYRLGFATATSAREDHWLEPVASGQRAVVVLWTDDIGAGFERLVELGAEPVHGPRPWTDGLLIAWATDPDGHLIQVVQRAN